MMKKFENIKWLWLYNFMLVLNCMLKTDKMTDFVYYVYLPQFKKLTQNG